MELKVWAEGIQRVVCGLTEDTTCQDVVVALALATKQTGRFTLIEKWRNNERFVSPKEKLFDVTSKWGEYTNDVHFLLRKSPAKLSYHQAKSHNNHSSSNNNNNNHNHNHRHTRGLEKGPNKALGSLFKQINGRNSSLSSFSSDSPTPSASLKGTPSPPALQLADDNKTTSPYSSLLPCPYSNSQIEEQDGCKLVQNSHKQNINSSSSCSCCCSSLSSSSSSQCQCKPSTSSCEDDSLNCANNNSSPQSSNCPYSSPNQFTKKATDTSPSSDSQSSPLGDPSNHPSHHRVNSVSHSSNKLQTSPSTYQNGQRRGSRSDESPKKCAKNEFIKSTNDSSSPSTSSSATPPRDPLRIVSSLQSNALMSQDLIDHKVQREIAESIAADETTNLLDLSSNRHQQDEIDKKKKELDELLNNIKKVESDTVACKEKINQLTQQIEEEQSLLVMKKKQREERQNLNELQKALEEKENIYTKQQLDANKIKEGLSRMTDELKLKEDEMMKLESDLRCENLKALTIESSDNSISPPTGADSSESPFVKLHSDIKRPLSTALLGTGFYNRIGSTRKIMAYPRYLQSATPTKKNPQGVWV